MRERFAGRSAEEVAAMLAELEGWREQVLDRARIRAGETVADVGAGTGLLTLGARERVGAEGQVVALDVSVDALYELLRAVHQAEAAGIALRLGAAEVLPLPDESVDVVVTRSVLIYVADKAEAAREFHRVLRPGGRVSLFEPVNARNDRLSEAVDFGTLAGRVRAWEERDRGDDPMLDFVEADLERLFAEAGFDDVELEAGAGEWTPTLDTVGAPGRKSLRAEWQQAFAPDEVERLVVAFTTAEPVRLRTPNVLLAARKP